VAIPFAILDTSTTFSNIAEVLATSPTGKRVSDTSASGNNADPDADGDPTNNTGATELVLEPVAEPKDINIRIDKQVSGKTYAMGEVVPYTVTVSSDNEFEPVFVDIIDTLPVGTSYVEDTAMLTVGDAEAIGEVISEDGQLTWRQIRLAPQEEAVISYSLRIGPGASESLSNIVEAVGEGTSGRITSKVEANADITVNLELFDLSTSVLTGRVFLDVNNDGEYNSAIDVPIENARLVLGNGWQALTDVEGNYAFREVPTGDVIVQLDSETVVFTPRYQNEASDDGYTHRVRIEGLTVSDFPLLENSFSNATRETTVQFGPLTVRKIHMQTSVGQEVILELSSAEAIGFPVKVTDPVPGASDQVIERMITTNFNETIRYMVPQGTPMSDPMIEWAD